MATGTASPCVDTTCAINQYVASNVCTACAAGKARAAGDKASGVDTACCKTLCPANTHVKTKACVACSNGKTNAAGDDASGTDTTCDVAVCTGATEAVKKDGSCQACPKGTKVTAGLKNPRVATTYQGKGSCDNAGADVADDKCGKSKNMACNAESCASAGYTWKVGQCVVKATGATTSAKFKACTDEGTTEWIDAATATKKYEVLFGTDSNLAAHKDCAVITCKDGKTAVASPNTGNAFGEHRDADGTACTACAAGTTLRKTAQADKSTAADKIATGAIDQNKVDAGTGGSAKTGILVLGLFQKDVAKADADGYVKADCLASTCGLQQQVVGNMCVECAVGKWRTKANGADDKRFTTATNAPCEVEETCGPAQYTVARSAGRCELADSTTVAGTFTWATCIDNNKDNTWRVCTNCAAKCFATKSVSGVAPGGELTGSKCGATFDKACNTKANCIAVDGVWRRGSRQDGVTTRKSSDALTETDSLCKTTCPANTYIDATKGKCHSDLSGGADATGKTKAQCDAAGDWTWYPSCEACAAGKYRAAGDSIFGPTTACHDIYCADNFRVDATSMQCECCPPGTYKTHVGGKSKATSATDTEDVKACVHTLCAKDTFVQVTNLGQVNEARSCEPCPAGTSKNWGGADGKGIKDKDGDLTFHTKTTTCEPTTCDVNHFVDATDRSRCRKCPAGKTSDGGEVTTCAESFCAPGSYLSAVDKCTACPSWEAAVDTSKHPMSGASGFQTGCTAQTCMANEYVAVSGKCGITAGAGDKPVNSCGANNELSCGSKKNCETAGTVGTAKLAAGFWTKTGAKCKTCSTGKLSKAGGALSGDAATECTPDATVTPGNDRTYDNDSKCAANFRVVNNKCVACPDGQVRAAGDDPTQNADTACAKPSNALLRSGDTLCKAGEHVQNHACVACPNVGWTTAGGDDPHHHDTPCHKIKCKVNEYVKDHVCTSCTGKTLADAGNHVKDGGAVGHMTNTAGDDASGDDTKCYVHLI
jgi:hypothetical protein